MASAEDNVLLRSLLDLLREDPDRIRSLLVQAGTGRDHESNTNHSPSPSSTASSPATDSPGSRTSDPEIDQPEANTGRFTADELLQPRRFKIKATAAQQTFAYILREAAKSCEIWENAPRIKDIPAKKIAKFEKKVTNELPQLAGRSKDILRRLSVSLINRRNHKNNTIYWKRAHQIDKYKGIACNRPPVSPKDGKSIADVVEERLEGLEGSGFVFKSAEALLIMDGDVRLARASYIRHAKRNSDYVRVVLQSVFNTVGKTKIPLCGSLNREKWLQDIKVGQKFYWPENQVVKASRIKTTGKKKSRGSSKKNKKGKAGRGDGDGNGKKKKDKKGESTGVEGLVAASNDVLDNDVAGNDDDDDDVAGNDDDVVAGNDDVDVVASDEVVDEDDVEAGDAGETHVVVDNKSKDGVSVGLGDEAAGNKRKKTYWTYVPIVEVEQQPLPPKRQRYKKKNNDFLSY